MIEKARGVRAGMTLIEICVAVGILAFCFLPIMTFSQSNIRETQVSQEDLLARHFLIDMVEAYKGEQIEKLKLLPPALVPMNLGEDEPNIKKNQMLNEQDTMLTDLQAKVAADPTNPDAGGLKGVSVFLDMKKAIQLSRCAYFIPGTPPPAGGPAVHTLVCVVKWMSSVSKAERQLEFSKIIVR